MSRQTLARAAPAHGLLGAIPAHTSSSSSLSSSPFGGGEAGGGVDAGGHVEAPLSNGGPRPAASCGSSRRHSEAGGFERGKNAPVDAVVGWLHLARLGAATVTTAFANGELRRVDGATGKIVALDK